MGKAAPLPEKKGTMCDALGSCLYSTRIGMDSYQVGSGVEKERCGTEFKKYFSSWAREYNMILFIFSMTLFSFEKGVYRIHSRRWNALLDVDVDVSSWAESVGTWQSPHRSRHKVYRLTTTAGIMAWLAHTCISCWSCWSCWPCWS